MSQDRMFQTNVQVALVEVRFGSVRIILQQFLEHILELIVIQGSGAFSNRGSDGSVEQFVQICEPIVSRGDLFNDDWTIGVNWCPLKIQRHRNASYGVAPSIHIRRRVSEV